MNNIDTLLNDFPLLDIGSNSSELSSYEDLEIKLDDPIVSVEGIDPRIKLLSHSSRGTLHSCPRKFQLYRLNSLEQEQADSIKNSYQQLTFDYGHAVGTGIQDILEGKSLDSALLNAFLNWNVDITLRNPKQNKSFWEALLAIQQFAGIVETGYLDDYELVHWNGKPAIELSFRITLPNGFKYRGYIDAVLIHKLTGVVVVLENKTTSYREVNSAQYKNSGQAVGYSVVLDHIFSGLSSYTVLYLIYATPLKEYIEMPFEKSSLQRALWLTELLIECKKIELYEAFSTYPMHGESCYNFYHECEYLGLCTLNTERLIKPLRQSTLDKIEKEQYDFDLNFTDLIETQIEKNS